MRSDSERIGRDDLAAVASDQRSQDLETDRIADEANRTVAEQCVEPVAELAAELVDDRFRLCRPA